MSSLSKYSPVKLQLAKDYAEGGYRDLEQVIPTGEGLALLLGVSRKTLFNWRDKHDDFALVMEHMNCKQALTCLNKGLKGEFNPVITKQVLARHGYHDKIDSDMTTKGDSMQPTFVFNPVGADD